MTTEPNPFEQLIATASDVVEKFPRLASLMGQSPSKVQARLNLVRIDMEYERDEFAQLLGVKGEFLSHTAPLPALEVIYRLCEHAPYTPNWIYQGHLADLTIGAACRLESIAQEAWVEHKAAQASQVRTSTSVN